MAKGCVYIPSKGAKLFLGLKKLFGYKLGRDIFLRAINPDFINDYRNTLTLDSEGVPTIDSIMGNSFMLEHIGDTKIIEVTEKLFPVLDDTLDNYNSLLEAALNFNITSSNRDKYIAFVDRQEDKLKVAIAKKNANTSKLFLEQYGAFRLNRSLELLFSPLGLTPGKLTQLELTAGRVGVTDFSMVRDTANGFNSIVRIANNMEGAQSLSEEFSHLLVGIFRNDTLIDRAINYLANNEDALHLILGEDFNDVSLFYDEDISMVAEEALGKILKDNLLKILDKEPVKTPNLFKRVINYILNKFRQFRADDVTRAINYADTITSKLAQDILEGTRQITQEDIINSRREARFNNLSDRINRNIEILKHAADIETKRYKISGDTTNRSFFKDKVDKILVFTTLDANTVEGLLEYSKNALNNLRALSSGFNNLDSDNPLNTFNFLRKVRLYTLSYGTFIQRLNDARIEESSEADNVFLINFELEGEEINLADVVRELNDLSNELSRRFSLTAISAFTEFCKPYFGENITIPYGPRKGEVLTIESLIKESEGDISFLDRWLDSMGNSSDLLLLIFDLIVKSTRHVARLNTMDNIRAILRLRLEAESLGITDFEWIFEKDDEGNKSGNYISEVNHALFDKDRKSFEEYLSNKYGSNPTGEDAKAKLEERKLWYEVNALGIFGVPVPNPTIYGDKKHNAAWHNLTPALKTIYTKFMDMKKFYDGKLPSNRTSKNKAILNRKTGSLRFLDSLASPSTIFENIKETIASSLLERLDDDLLFGNVTKKGLTDFASREFITLPVLYTNRLENPNELSTDIFSSLMLYAYMANNYEQMEKVIDPLEIGRIVATEERKIRETRGGDLLVEKFDALGRTVTSKIFKGSGTYFELKLNDFFESLVYWRYLKDEGTFDILGKKVNVNKLTSLLLKNSSLALLGFNWLANLANVTTGGCMLHIEGASGQFFNLKELAKADAAYAAAMKDFAMDIPRRMPKSKLALVDELFNVRQDFGKKVKSTQKKNWFERIFGAEIAFLGLDSGDHWLYNRTAIAMMLRHKVKVNGLETNLWDALEVKNKFLNNDDIKELNWRNITELDGSPLDIRRITEEIAHVNHTLFGIYNDEDSNAANRVAMGRLLQLYRKWIKPLMNKRFLKGLVDMATGTYEEGYYRTLIRIANELRRGEIQFGEMWDKMESLERQNLIRCIVELALFMAVWAIANWVEWPDDKNRPWAIKLAEYASKRLAHELGGLAPTTVMLLEQLKTIKEPLPCISVCLNTLNLINSALSPSDYLNEILSGPYKGMSTFEKNFIKAPIPGVALYRLIDKFIDEIDTSITYYARPR